MLLADALVAAPVREKPGSGGDAGTGSVFHVRPNGSPRGDGSRDEPWDLQTALLHPSDVRPGDTILVHTGTYVGGFTSRLRGAVQDPIVVRAAPGQRPRIDLNDRNAATFALFRIEGRYTQFLNLEIFCSDTDSRRSAHRSSWPQDQDRGSVEIYGEGIKLTNMILHDLNKGVGFWSAAVGGEIYGSIIYNNGWMGTDRVHGPAIYTQNTHATPKRIADNVIMNQFYSGLYVTGSSDTEIDNYLIEGNILFNTGAALGAGFNPRDSVLIGGGNPADNVIFRENFVYTFGDLGAVRFGLNAGGRNVEITDNYIYDNLMMYEAWEDLTVTGNTLGGKLNYTVDMQSPPPDGKFDDWTWDDNHYFATRIYPFQIGNQAKSFQAWQRETGLDAHSTVSFTEPTGTLVQTRPNEYEPGRAHIVVYNWDDADSVQVDLSNVVPPGDGFEIRNVLDLFGPPLVSIDAYNGGPVTLPMHATTSPRPIGWEAAPHVQPKEFGAFLVQPTSPTSMGPGGGRFTLAPLLSVEQVPAPGDGRDNSLLRPCRRGQ